MAPESSPLLFLSVFLAMAILFPLAPLALARIWAKKFAPPKPGADKNAIYECGLQSQGDAWIQFRAEYYLYAIIFLVFDVEAVFLFPFAVVFGQLPFGALAAMALFLLLIVEGWAWAWMKGIFTLR